MSEGAAGGRQPWLIALQDLYERRGQPRTRALGLQSGMSHETVAQYLKGGRKPPLDKYVRLMKALGANGDEATDLWLDSRVELLAATPTERELLADILAELRAIRAALGRDANGSPEAL